MASWTVCPWERPPELSDSDVIPLPPSPRACVQQGAGNNVGCTTGSSRVHIRGLTVNPSSFKKLQKSKQNRIKEKNNSGCCGSANGGLEVEISLCCGQLEGKDPSKAPAELCHHYGTVTEALTACS